VSTSPPPAAAEQNLVEVPLYTPLDVARYLRAPVWAVLAMWRGRFPPDPDWFFHRFGRRFPPFGPPDDITEFPEFADRLSFRRLADLYVRYFAVQSVAELERGEPGNGKKHPALHEAAWRFLNGHDSGPVIFGETPPDEGVARLIGSCAPHLVEVERHWLEKRLRLCLSRVDVESGSPLRLYPFSRVPVEGCPKTIVLDPRIRFGRPTITGRGVPTDVVFERHQAGDSIAELAEDYGLPAEEVEEAVRYEAAPPSLLFPFFGW
jgi:uncharacterized protein (DUF433 family)